MLFAHNVRQIMIHPAHTRLQYGSSTGLYRIQKQCGQLVEIVGAMPVCVTNDCSDSLDVWPCVLSSSYQPFISISTCSQTLM